MKRSVFGLRIRQLLALGLFTGLGFFNFLAYQQIVGHTVHHIHHNAATHTTPLCFWVCTAGQMEEAPNVSHVQISMPIGVIDMVKPGIPPVPLPRIPSARGPPSLRSPVL